MTPSPTPSRLQTLADHLAAPGITVAGWAVLLMMVMATADVVSTVFNRPIAGAHEGVEMLMVVVIFLALPYAESRGQHIAVDLVFNRLPPRVRQALGLFALVLALVFFGAMAWQGWKLFWASWLIREYASGAVRMPVYPAKALFALGVTASTAVLVIKIAAAWRAAPAPAAAAALDKPENT